MRPFRKTWKEIASVITLYHCTNARSLRVLWALKELDLPFELVLTPFPPRSRYAGYLEINPMGTTPTLVDGGVTMTESAAIIHYLATRYGPTRLAVQPSETDYGAYLNFLVMGEATLTFPQTIVLRYSRLESDERRLPQAVDDYRKWFLARLKAATKLMGEEFVCAGRFTVADISVAYATFLAVELGLREQLPDRAARHLALMMSRPAFEQAMQAQQKPA